MFLVGIMTWWYGDGWRQRFHLMGVRISRTVDYFSIPLLVGTLFAPFRQISAGKSNGPIGVQLRALADQLISRVIGGFVRSFMIVFGLVTIMIQAIFGAVIMALWAIVPLLPVIGLIAWVIGWTP